MIRDKFDIKSLFHEMIRLSLEDLRNGKGRTFGFAANKLMDDMIMRQGPFLDRIVGDYSGESHEYRLNEAGLKMNWRMTKHYRTGERVFMCVITGDQYDDYSVLGPQLRSLIKQRGCCKWAYDNDRREYEQRHQKIKWKNIK